MASQETQALARKPSALRIASIERAIYFVRGQKVMLDADLARLYEVPTSRLNEQVRRNRSRFPKDFMFQLTVEELPFDIANCDLKPVPRRTALSPLRIHRTGRRDALERA
jgi:ORF6N domain